MVRPLGTAYFVQGSTTETDNNRTATVEIVRIQAN